MIAALHESNRLEICRKLVHEAVDDGADALDVLYDIGVGDYGDEDWRALRSNLRRLGPCSELDQTSQHVSNARSDPANHDAF